MISKRSLLRQKIRHDAKNTSRRQTVRHNVKMFVMMLKHVMITQDSSLLQKSFPWRHKVCHDIGRFVMTLQIRQMFVMKSNIRHDVKNTAWCQNTSWWQKISHYFKKFVITSKRRHYFKKTSWCQKVYHKIKKHVMTSQSSSWCQKSSSWHQKHTMTSKGLSWGQQFVMK